MSTWNEDMRVKIPATIQFMRLGYSYQSLKDIDLHKETRISINRFKPALERINNQSFSDSEIIDVIEAIHDTLKNNDMGKSFFEWLLGQNDKPKLIDFENIDNNDFAVVDELFFGPKEKGSFRPDINVLINGIPLAFLEVKKPNNEGGIQAEFRRMLDKRLVIPEYKKYFNMLQVVSFSNNMEYENDDDVDADDVKAGSFYTTPNGFNTTFSFFREESRQRPELIDITPDTIRYVLKDNRYSPSEYEAPEFQLNLEPTTPCNSFVTSLFERERLLFYIHYGITYVDGKVPQKHIMRYPQFFASKAILKRLQSGGKSGVIWHTQGSGKTGLSAFSVRILRDYYASRNITARFYYVVDRLELLTQVSNEMSRRGLNVINVTSRKEFESELNRPLSKNISMKANGEITVVNIQKFNNQMPTAKNDYNANIQRIFFIDEAHRSYKLSGEFFKNLMLVDPDAVYIAMTGTPLLSCKERSNLKFGDYIHKYFYDKSIADGYTLRIKKEDIDTTARAVIKRNLDLPDNKLDKSAVVESNDYVDALCSFIDKDFINFRLINADDTIGGMIVCCSNTQAKKIKSWFDDHSTLSAGLVISDESIPSAVNRNTQIAFKETLKPDVLIVHQMLTTGYDVRRLKKMYLLRNAKEHTLLQTISRVNRPYKSPNGKVYKYGYIVDFVDIAEEYDRTIEMYLKELEEDFNSDDNSEENGTLSGLIIGPDDINNKYLKYRGELASIVDISNLEAFSKMLTYFSKDALLTIRRLLNGIKNCHTEFMISRAMDYAEQIDISAIRKLIGETQNRIDFLNLKAKPSDLMNVVSNKEVVEILYEFFKVKVSVLDMSILSDAMKDFCSTDEYRQITENVISIQEEVKRNKNHNQTDMVKLDELLKKIFAKLEIADLDNLSEINNELASALDEIRRINQENERISVRYDGNYAFVKTYTDVCELYPEFDKDDLSNVVDVVYEAYKAIRDANILVLQGRDNFTASIKKGTIAVLLKSGLYKKLCMKEWYTALLNEVYANVKIF